MASVFRRDCLAIARRREEAARIPIGGNHRWLDPRRSADRQCHQCHRRHFARPWSSSASDEMGALRLRSAEASRSHRRRASCSVLLVSARLVGKGTVYSWVYSTCWFAAIPVFLILVRWWREVVFERVERVRRKSALQAWMLVNRSGWKSFFAAMVAAVQLFARRRLQDVAQLGDELQSGAPRARVPVQTRACAPRERSTAAGIEPAQRESARGVGPDTPPTNG